MKTIKRHFPAALLLLVLSGCAIDEPYQATRTEEKQITIKAIREDDDTPETRTVRNEKGKVYWSKGDQISLFYGHGTNGGSVFTSTQEADTVKVTNFVGTITAITGGGDITIEDTYFWGLYPYNETASCDGSSIITSLPSFQVAYPGSYAPGTNISVGRSQGLIMGFYNACGGFRFSLNKEGVKKVTFKGRNGENLAGKLKISFVNGKVNTQILEGENEVVLEAPAGEYFEPGVLYYFVLAPTTLSNGFTVKVETFTEETTFTYEESITIEASNFKSKKLMDTGLTWTQKTGNIPIEDANFKAYLVENFDGNGDGEISYEEAKTITTIDVCTDNIESVQGIEFLTYLRTLRCYGSYAETGLLTVLDVTGNSSIIQLDCSHNRLLELNISYNTELTKLYCDYNQLRELDVSNNTALTVLSCGSNDMLTTLDVSNNTDLEELYCYFTQVTELDVSRNTELLILSCFSNQLTTLDVSKNTKLITLSCKTNHLRTLNLFNNSELTYLYCSGNNLVSLIVSNSTKLTKLYCDYNQLRELDVTNNTALTILNCESNLLQELDVSNNIALKSLDCSTMNDSEGNNLLQTLFVYQGQELRNVTFDRDCNSIPLETEIVIVLSPNHNPSELTYSMYYWGSDTEVMIDSSLPAIIQEQESSDAFVSSDIYCDGSYYYFAIPAMYSVNSIVCPETTEDVTENFPFKGDFLFYGIPYNLYEYHLRSGLSYEAYITVTLTTQSE